MPGSQQDSIADAREQGTGSLFDRDALVRSIGITGPGRFMLLLGAGASASSGAPTSSQCVWEWKRDIYLSGNPRIGAEHVLDVSLPTVRRRIQRWLDDHGGFPREGDPEEYSHYVERAYPREDDRRSYFEERLSTSMPQVGYQLLAVLQNSHHFAVVWTPNFDGLVRRAWRPQLRRTFKEVGQDTTARLEALRGGDDAAYVVHLHGDYRYDRLKNTTPETQALDETVRHALTESVRHRPLVVVGYSGKDESIMDALRDAVAVPSSGGRLYWCVQRGTQVSDAVRDFLVVANKNGYDGLVVEIESFDDLMIRVARYVHREGPASVEAAEILAGMPAPRSPFALDGYRPDEDWLKSNGFPVELPRELFQFQAAVENWKDLRAIVGDSPLECGLLAVHLPELIAVPER
jgi:hypothetical protein